MRPTLFVTLATLLSFAGGGCGSNSAAPGHGSQGGAAGDALAGAGGAGGASGASGVGGLGFGTDGGIVPREAGSDADAGNTCASMNVEGERIPASILFVIDRSGSMNCNPPPVQTTAQCDSAPVPVDTNSPSKWDVLRQSLKAAIVGMPDSTSVGLLFFSNGNPGTAYCDVAMVPDVGVGPLAMPQRDALNASIDGVVAKGDTPIIGGAKRAYSYITANSFAGDKFVVLLTDGYETCVPDDKESFLTNTVPGALQYYGIRTFVIGAPGSEQGRAFLSRFAWAGGTARDPSCVHDATPTDVGDCHFDMTQTTTDFATELNHALNLISGQTVSCQVSLPPPPEGGTFDLESVNVTFNPGVGMALVPLLQDTTAPCDSGADGWQYSDDKTKVFLCGSACDNYKNNPRSSVSIGLGCKTMRRIPH